MKSQKTTDDPADGGALWEHVSVRGKSGDKLAAPRDAKRRRQFQTRILGLHALRSHQSISVNLAECHRHALRPVEAGFTINCSTSVDPTVNRLNQMGCELRIDLFRGLQNAFQHLCADEFLADLAQVGTKLDPLAADAMAVLALDGRRFEKQPPPRFGIAADLRRDRRRHPRRDRVSRKNPANQTKPSASMQV
ncbi:MAG TPA: hypothetical protein VGN42_01640 [Pirellulales bacterium]|nr:hypothetical protein [Pirellulales bacterium]